MSMKKCMRCHVEKPLEDFYKQNRRGRTEPYSRCKQCNTAINVARNANLTPEQRHAKRQDQQRRYNDGRSRDTVKHHQLKAKFGITLADFNQMVAAQNNCCAICGRPETTLRRGQPRCLSVDHDHRTGKIRQLLCLKCNVALGAVNDDVAILQNMIDYVTRHAASGTPRP